MDKQTVDDELETNRKFHFAKSQDDYKTFFNDGINYQQTYERGTGFRRYKNSLKNLMPIRRKIKDDATTSIDNAGLFSFISFSWLSNIMHRAHKNGITVEELPTLSPYDVGTYNAKRLELFWKDELAKRGPENASFLKVAWRFSRTRILASCLLYSASLVSGFISFTYLMRKLLEFVESGTGSYEEGLKWAMLLTIAEMCRPLFLSCTWTLSHRTALRLRSACLTLLYAKILRVHNLGNKNMGKMINIFSNDAQKIYDSLVMGPMIIGAPLTMVLGVFYVLWYLGPMALLGMVAFLLFFPIQYLISRLTGYFQNKSVKISDKRVRLMNEILDSIKLIKMYAWEKRFSDDVLNTRKLEQRFLLRTSYCQSFSEAVAPAVPVLSAIITFLAHISVGNNMTAAQVFPYITLLDSGLRLSIYFFQYGIYAVISAKISLDRIKSLLLLPNGNCLVSKPTLESQAVAISRGTFAYDTFDDSREADSKKRKNAKISTGEEGKLEQLNKFTNDDEHVDVLFGVSFEATKGKLVGICGQVGSGKSSLLRAALGQLHISAGEVTRDGSCAYVSQEAWITNATLRENILFGEEFDDSRYREAIYACNLIQDIDAMPGGDRTEIGEKGVNLSGGQKQRVALARALYADRDIYFLDDPLSAVDSRVGSYIFEHLILGALKGKTVLFVTHQIQYLNRCDDIYMMRDGRIIEHGTHEDLMKPGNEYACMVAAIAAGTERDDDQNINPLPGSIDDIPVLDGMQKRPTSVNSDLSAKDSEIPDYQNAQLTVAEDLQRGTIKAHTYKSYIIAAGGYCTFFIVILTFLATALSVSFSSWWLALWIQAGGGIKIINQNNETVISDNINDNPNFSFYQSIYASTIIAIILTSAVRSVVYTKTTVGASTNMHNNLFKKIITCPMRFFDTTPLGRIQHLFSRDVDEVDTKLPYALACVLENIIAICFAMLIICLVFPWFTLPLCILGSFYYFVSRIFRVAIRDLKRMENTARTLVISFVATSVQGINTIHAFGKEHDFMTKFTKLFDQNSMCLFLSFGAMRWLAVRVDFLSVLITSITSILVILLRVPPALAGLALTHAAQISDMFQYTVRILSDTEVRFISVERLNHYIRTLISEGNENPEKVKPPSTWPSAALIKFVNVGMAYGKGAPLILKNVTFTVYAGEKIGIVGRTGSGKSSLTVALFRLVELAEGKIEIDDVDISEISLSQLRSKLSIIPQDPVLFSGTIRSNLDPFKLYTDLEIWEALERTELKGRIQSINGQLDASVGFGGDNLSVGERQLLCLARALLRNSKILVLDEATAAVDPETEIVVQNTIQEAFSHCTILTIAHRLQTVLSLDRILVMNDGNVLEFDTPSNLLSDQSSEFSKMIAAAEQAETH